MLRVVCSFARPACMKTWCWPFFIMIFPFLISNDNLKYSILPSYFIEEKSLVSLVIHCRLYSDSFTNKKIFVCPQFARGLVYGIGLEVNHEQISYITSIYLHAKLFCGISILVPRYLFTLKSWPRSGNIVIPGPQWSYCTIYELKCLWLAMFWFQREFDTKTLIEQKLASSARELIILLIE